MLSAIFVALRQCQFQFSWLAAFTAATLWLLCPYASFCVFCFQHVYLFYFCLKCPYELVSSLICCSIIGSFYAYVRDTTTEQSINVNGKINWLASPNDMVISLFHSVMTFSVVIVYTCADSDGLHVNNRRVGCWTMHLADGGQHEYTRTLRIGRAHQIDTLIIYQHEQHS